MLQSSYRFVSITVCFLAFSVARLAESVVVSKEGRKSYESRTTMTACIMIAIVCIASYMSNFYGFFRKNDQVLYYDQVIGAIESAVEDYLPAGTQTEWYESDAGYVSDEDAVASLAYKREGTYVYYSYTNSREGAYVEFPRFYYDGYIAKDEMSEDVEVFKGDRNRTRVYLEKTDTPAVIRMWYYVPWYMTFAVSVSLSLWLISFLVLSLRIYIRIE